MEVIDEEVVKVVDVVEIVCNDCNSRNSGRSCAGSSCQRGRVRRVPAHVEVHTGQMCWNGQTNRCISVVVGVVNAVALLRQHMHVQCDSACRYVCECCCSACSKR